LQKSSITGLQGVQHIFSGFIVQDIIPITGVQGFHNILHTMLIGSSITGYSVCAEYYSNHL